MKSDQDLAISVKNLTKIFRIYDRPSDRLKEVFSLSRKSYHTDYTVLDKIDFEISKGDFVGIMGRNGAGKSTLLRLLSKELTPTEGEIRINGTVSLLQLGVGFDSELTGVENARFATKLLGFSEAEVDKMLNEIIEFADIGEFIHHPVKTYSSGMYSRLSFAVGINVNPDILIADEVLSVGDARFSQKCLRKMHEIKDSGKTVILVTHSTSAVGVFCNKAIWLKDGKIFEIGEAKSVSENYNNWILYDRLPGLQSLPKNAQATEIKANVDINLKTQSKTKVNLIAKQLTMDKIHQQDWIDVSRLPCIRDGKIDIKKAIVCKQNNIEEVGVLKAHDEISLIYKIIINEEIKDPYFGWILYDQNAVIAIHSNNHICKKSIYGKFLAGTEMTVKFDFRLPPLNKGSFIFSISAGYETTLSHRIHDFFPISIVNESEKKEQCGYLLVEHENFSYEIEQINGA